MQRTDNSDWQKKLNENEDARKRQEADALEDKIAWSPHLKDKALDTQGNTFMHQAVLSRNEHAIRKLLLQDASMRVRNNSYETPVSLAFRSGYTDGLEIFSQLCKDSTLEEKDRQILAKHRSIYDPVPAGRLQPRSNPVKAPVSKPLNPNASKTNYGTGLFPSSAPAAKSVPMQVQSTNAAHQKPFMDEDIELLIKYLDKLEKTGDTIVKTLLDQIKDSISMRVMSDPVYLGTCGRVFDRETLDKIVPVNGVRFCPFSRKPFTDADISPSIDAIQRIQTFLDLALKEQQQQRDQGPAPMKM